MKTVLITGASSGIGKALALEFGSKGYAVIITGRDESKLLEMSNLLSMKNINHCWIKADVSIEEDNKRTIEEIQKKYGRLDVLINNAGISMRAMFNDCSTEVIRNLMNINFMGTVYATKYALPLILESKGSIVGISSIAGYRGLPARTGYSASKFAMQGFLEALRTELLHKGVHILVAYPGFTNSNIRNTALNAEGNQQGESPLEEQKIMSAEEVAAHIYKAVINRKRDLIYFQQKIVFLLSKNFVSNLFVLKPFCFVVSQTFKAEK